MVSPGSRILYQDIVLEAGANHQLSFVLYYKNQQNGAFSSPPTLDYTASPNQQYRVDILRPSAPITSVAPGDVLFNIFQTQPGSPNTLAPTQFTVDLTAFAGGTSAPVR